MKSLMVISAGVIGLIFPGLAAAQTRLDFEAKAAEVTPPFILTNGGFFQTVCTGLTNGGRACFHFAITNAGDWVVRAKVEAPPNETNSFYVNIDAEPEDPKMIWDIAPTAGFQDKFIFWREPYPAGKAMIAKTFSLAEGQHQLILRGRGANTKVAHLSILQLPKPPQAPTGLRIVSGH